MSSSTLEPPIRASAEAGRPRLPRRLGQVGLVVLLGAVVTWWFAPFHSKTIMGDDVLVWSLLEHSSVLEVPYKPWAQAQKFRPVAAICMYLELRLTHFDFNTCVWVNRGFHLLVCFAVFVMMRQASRSGAVAAILAVLFAVSRFSYYNLLQVSGLVESLCLLLLVLLLSRGVRFARRGRRRDAVWLAVLFALLIHTHERYAVLFPFLGLLVVLNGRGWAWRAVPILLMSGVVALNIGAKIWLGLHLLEGTGGQPITLSPASVLGFAAAGLANILGVSIGPGYLTAFPFEAMSWYAKLNAVLIAGCFLGILLARYAGAWFRFLPEARRALPWLGCLALLLGSASITFRQEMRWLYAPYLVLLLGVAAAAGRVRPAAARWGLLGCCLLLVVGNEYRFRKRADYYFFMSAQATADQVYEVTIHRHAAELAARPFYVIGTRGDVAMKWILLGGEFFRYHLGPVDVRFVDSILDADFTGGALAFAYDSGTGRLEEVTDSPSQWALPALRPGVDLVEAFPRGRISSSAPADTPTRRGVFVHSWSKYGLSGDGVTVINGYRYEYPEISVAPDDVLCFRLLAPFPQCKGMRAYVEVRTPEGSRRVFQRDVKPAEGWIGCQVPLREFAGQEVRVEVGADIPPWGDANAAWLVFGWPAVGAPIR